MEELFSGSREAIRRAFAARLVPSSAIPALLASLSDATIRQYSRPLRSWWIFCQRHNVSFYLPTVFQTLDFLSHELPAIFSYSSLNTMRSAISLVSNNEIGTHPMVKRFCKGVAVLKPPRPRYDYVWDPAPVIAQLASIYPYNSVDLKSLTQKLVLLLALGTGHRVQTLSSLRLSHFSLHDKLIIRVPDRIKTSAPGRTQPIFFVSLGFQITKTSVSSVLQKHI